MEFSRGCWGRGRECFMGTGFLSGGMKRVMRAAWPREHTESHCAMHPEIAEEGQRQDRAGGWPGPPQHRATRSFRGPPGEQTGPDWRPGREIQVDSSAGYADPDRTSTLGNLEGNDFNFFFSLFFLDSPVT